VSASRLPSYLRTLGSAVFAVFTPEGKLVDWNAGFAGVLGKTPAPDLDISSFFVNPRLAELGTMQSEDDAPLYEGLFTVGDADSETCTIRGGLYREGDCLLLAAEHDAVELLATNRKLLELNESLAAMKATLMQANRNLRASEARVRELAHTDALTGAANRRRFDETLAAEVVRAERYGSPLSVVFADLDHFKTVNDQWGHPAGDEVLRQFVQIMKADVRPSDLVARSGGEEFAILMPHTGAEAAVACAERIRLTFKTCTVAGVGQTVTSSFGVTHYERGEPQKQFLRRADRALYQAKESGRDRVVRA
jgi:diguanylate cyclase (GGDEF)-like protein